MTIVKRGMWVSDPPSVATKPEFYDEAKDLGFTVMAIMIDSSDSPWDPRWTIEELDQAARLIIQRDMELVLTTWPAPKRAMLLLMKKYMREALKVGAVAWESEAEGLWLPNSRKKKRIFGFKNLGEASIFYNNMKRELCEPLDVRREYTTHPYHPELVWSDRELREYAEATEEKRLECLLPHGEALSAQGYSTNKTPDGDPVTWNDIRHGPGAMQRFTFNRALKVPGVREGKPKLIAGLAAYRQKWPGHTEFEAMSRAYDTAAQFPIIERRYWQSIVIIGVNRNGYSEDFFRTIA